MKSKIAFTKKDLAVVLVCLVFLLMSLGAIGSGGRERAKRAVCLSNLKQLSLAWHQYADDNDGKIVNGAPMLRGGSRWGSRWGYADPPRPSEEDYELHANEKPWMGANRGWKNKGGTLEDSIAEQLRGIKDGSLWPYTKNEKLYRCPTGRRGDLSTYTVIDGMNGFYLWRGNGIEGKPGVWIKKKSEISNPSPSLRIVYIDEGYVGYDSFAVNYGPGGAAGNPESWFDSPPARHGGGVSLAFADGHSEYRKWKGMWTLAFAKASASVGTNMQTAFKRPGDEIDLTPEIPNDYNFKHVTATQDDFEDLQYIQKGCWGGLGYSPTH